jgi:hypothetical protein
MISLIIVHIVYTTIVFLIGYTFGKKVLQKSNLKKSNHI